MDKDIQCGIGSCRGPKLQIFANLMTFTVFYSIVATITNTMGSLLSSQITTLEKQFNIPSTLSGLLLTGGEIGYIIGCLFITHFARNAHIPKVLGAVGILFGISGIATCLTNFINPVSLSKEPVNANETNDDSKYLCRANNSFVSTAGNTISEDRSSSAPTLILIFMIVYGISKSSRTSLGSVYIDNNIQNKAKSPIYIGAVYSSMIFGPSIGLLVGSAFSNLPVDLKDTFMTSSDPRWISAWWLAFLLVGCLGIFVALPVFCIPRRLPGIPKPKVTSTEKHFSEIVKDLPMTLYRVLKRPVYALCLVNSIIYGFATSGMVSFTPKYVESQFNVPAWKTNLILGIAYVATAGIGTFIGGLMTGKMNLTRQGCIKFIIITNVISLLPNAAMLVLGCENTPIEGFDFFRNDTDNNQACNCEDTPFLPVCGSDYVTYASPCQAGCWNRTDDSYGDCSRVEGMTVTPGICDNGCEFLYPYLVAGCLNSVIGSLSIMPKVMVYMRSVEEQDKSMALAIFDFTSTLLGWIPAPIVYGQVIDSACKILLQTSSGSFGACALYDIEALRFKIYGLEVSLQTIAVLFMFLSLLACRWEDKNMKANEQELTKIEAEKNN